MWLFPNLQGSAASECIIISFSTFLPSHNIKIFFCVGEQRPICLTDATHLLSDIRIDLGLGQTAHNSKHQNT